MKLFLPTLVSSSLSPECQDEIEKERWEDETFRALHAQVHNMSVLFIESFVSTPAKNKIWSYWWQAVFFAKKS